MDSLINQSLIDIEIIAIDDCSPDNSLDILREYAAKDKRIRIIENEENLKLAGARNAGLAVAKGEYISIIDSDDYIDLGFLEKLYNLAIIENADIAKGVYRELPENALFDNNTEIQKNKWNFRWHLWTALFKRTLLEQHDIKFVIDTICFQVRAVYFSNKVSVCNDAVYYYCRRGDSNDSPVFTLEKWQSLNVRGADYVLDFINTVKIKRSDYVMLVTELILPLYLYGFRKIEDINKAKAADILDSVLTGFWKRVKHKSSLMLMLHYLNKRRELKKSGKEYIAIAMYSNEITTNIGDAIQENAIHDAIMKVAPDAKITKVARDSWQASKFRALNIMQGWFKYRFSIPKGRKLWIATHFSGKLRWYMKMRLFWRQSFGGRDLTTAAFIPGGYLSRCYTLTLPRRVSDPQEGKVFLTNIPEEFEQYIPEELMKNCVRITHHYKGEDMSEGARELVARYRDEASLVITRKVHCASPCTAMGIPVIAIPEGKNGSIRMSFLEGIIDIRTEQDLQDGMINWSPIAPDIEVLKQLMLENLRLSIDLMQGKSINRKELKKMRNRISMFKSIIT
jgi:glycosyltransferase involved in cell wall biosynthesis